jgi:RNA polymerase sigma-70 factor (ECF subfamily)
MDTQEQWDSSQLLAEARAGDQASLGRLLEIYRHYLQVLAGTHLSGRLRARVNPSDLVQEVFLRASRQFGDFGGTSMQEWHGWLQAILRRCLLKMIQRQVQARKRSVFREVCFDELGLPAEWDAVATSSSPSAPLRRRELAGLLAERLARLPAPYREVLVLRHLEGLPFAEVAQRLGKSTGAVRVLWLRALERLRQQPRIEELQ